MNIINKTKWNTKQLMKLINAVIKREGYSKPARITIQTIRNWGGGGYSGTAYCLGRQIIMRIPLTSYRRYESMGSDGKKVFTTKPTNFSSKTFAQILVHELGHLHGLHDHKDMLNLDKLECDWTTSLEVSPQEEKPKPKRNLIKERYEKALSKFKEKERLIKRNEKLLKKWKAKIKYYEKKIHTEVIE